MNRNRVTSAHAVLMFLLALGSGSRARAADLDAEFAVHYMNDVYIGDNWERNSNYLANAIVHSVATSLREESPMQVCGLGGGSVDVSKPPWFEEVAGGGLKVRIPGITQTPTANRRNYHSIYITASCGGDIYEADAHMYFAVNGLITTGPAAFSLDVFEMDIADVLADVVDVVSAGWLTGKILDAATGKLDKNLAAFMEMRWDTTLTLPDATVQFVDGADQKLPGESVIDILLVADGYTAATMPDFEATVETIADELLRSTDPERLEPISNYASTLRLWKLARPIPASEAGVGDSPYRLLGAVYHQSSYITTLHNVALTSLLPAKGIDVTVIIADARELTGNNIRANAVGRFVSLPSYARANVLGESLEDREKAKQSRLKTANVLVHELGHTPLGYLADEYSRTDEYYRGFEPAPVNVSKQQNSAKWQHHPDRDPTLGAYNFKRGAWRPYPTCRMNDSFVDIPGHRQHGFCPVCREALTVGIYDHMKDYPFLSSYFEALWPVRSSNNELAASPSGGYMGELSDLVTVTGTNDPTRTLMAVRGAAIPEPWNVRWTITRADGSGSDVVVGDEVVVDLFPDDVIDLSVDSNNDFIRDPSFPGFATLTAQINTRNYISYPEGPPIKPNSLAALPDDDPIAAYYDPDTGLATSDLRLAARARCYSKFVFECSTEWQLSGDDQTEVTLLTDPMVDNSDAPPFELAAGYVPEGTYTARARSSFAEPSGGEVRTSDWVNLDGSFNIGPLELASEPQPPHAPVMLRAATCDERVFLHGTAWDVNGDSFQLQFEVRPSGVAFRGDAEPSALITTELLGGQPDLSAEPPSLRYEGQARFESDSGGPYDWQARVVDADGQAGDWVRGPSFFLGAFSDCSITSARRRLADALDKNLRKDLIDGAWFFEPGLVNPLPGVVPCVGYRCEPFAILGAHLFDRLKAEPPVGLMPKLPEVIGAALTGREINDASPPPATVPHQAWKLAMSKSFGEDGKDLFDSSLAANVPAILFAETANLHSDDKAGVVTATVLLHAVNITEDKIRSVAALGTAKLEEVKERASSSTGRTFSEAEQEAISKGVYQATLQLVAQMTGPSLPSTLVEAPEAPPEKEEPPEQQQDKKAGGCSCETGGELGDSAVAGLLFGLVALILFRPYRRRRQSPQSRQR